MKWFITLTLLLGLGCGAQNVRPLDPRDESLPQETRQWVADAADGVIAARTRRDAAQRQLNEAQSDRARLTNQVRFEATGGNDPSGTLRLMLEARVALATLALAHAETRVEFAVQSERLANAEQALTHGRARYDLEPIEQAHERAQEQVQAAREELRTAEADAHRRIQEWWTAYDLYVRAGGRTLPFWTSLSDSAPVESTAIDNADGPTQATDDERPPMLNTGP